MMHHHKITIPNTNRILLITNTRIPIIHIQHRIYTTTQTTHIHPNNKTTRAILIKLNLMTQLIPIIIRKDNITTIILRMSHKISISNINQQRKI